MSDSFFQHPQSLVESDRIGKGTRVWAFAHILAGAEIGADCNICDHTFIENDVVIGDRVTIKCGVQVWDGVRIEDDVFVGPNVTFTNDPNPRSQKHLDRYPETVICRGASLGANSTILPGIRVGEHAMIGAGAVVTRDVPRHAVLTGNPGRIVRYAEDTPSGAEPETVGAASRSMPEIIVDGVSLHEAPVIRDLRGSLSARETGAGLPFAPARYFVVYDVPSPKVRGAHAHRRCKQLLVVLRGSMSCLADDGQNKQEFVLDGPERALLLPPMVWGAQYKFSPDAVLMVLASDPYDPDDYIRDYAEFIEERQAYDA